MTKLGICTHDWKERWFDISLIFKTFESLSGSSQHFSNPIFENRIIGSILKLLLFNIFSAIWELCSIMIQQQILCCLVRRLDYHFHMVMSYRYNFKITPVLLIPIIYLFLCRSSTSKIPIGGKPSTPEQKDQSASFHLKNWKNVVKLMCHLKQTLSIKSAFVEQESPKRKSKHSTNQKQIVILIKQIQRYMKKWLECHRLKGNL